MGSECPAIDKKLLRTWLNKLSSSEPLSFEDTKELNLLMSMYDTTPSHPVQYRLQSRFKEALPAPDEKLCSIALSNADMNRTNENYPTDEGLLKTDNGGFINASQIEGKDRSYIATQHPLPSTMIDFWKMILAEKPNVVVMLNKYDFDQSFHYKQGGPELVQYWPDDNPKTGVIESLLLEDKESGGTVKISVVHEPTASIEEVVESDEENGEKARKKRKEEKPKVEEDHDDLQVKQEWDAPMTSSDSKNSKIECSKLRVEYKGQHHDVWHIRCGGWKDQDAPDTDLFMDLWRTVEQKLKDSALTPGEKHKLVVHCTGGVGRTGTFITVDIAGQELKNMTEKNPDHATPFSIDKIIHFLRKKRMNMVGSTSQYIFCHKAALQMLAEHNNKDTAKTIKQNEEGKVS